MWFTFSKMGIEDDVDAWSVLGVKPGVFSLLAILRYAVLASYSKILALKKKRKKKKPRE